MNGRQCDDSSHDNLTNRSKSNACTNWQSLHKLKQYTDILTASTIDLTNNARTYDKYCLYSRSRVIGGSSHCKATGKSSSDIPFRTASACKSMTVTFANLVGLTQAKTQACMPNRNGTTE